MHEKRIQVLIGEDNYAELKLFEIAAQESGLSQVAKLVAATDGDEVIHKLNDSLLNARPYDLLVLDLNMPKISGLAVLQHIKESELPKPFIIVLTNSDNPSDRNACLASGADTYLQKPADFYEMEDFCKVLKNCLELNNCLNTEFIRMNYNGVH